jgi:DNA-binding protein YbaB
MPSFSEMKDMYKIQREAKRIKKELKNVHVEAEAGAASSLGGYTVKVVVSAEQEIISVQIAPEADASKLSELLKDALNRALKKAQVVAAERMQVVMKQMGMPTGGLGSDE